MNNLDFYDLKLTNFKRNEIEKYFNDVISSSESKVIFGWGFGQIPLIRLYKTILDDTNSSDVLLCDGTNFYRFVKLMGFKLGDFLSIPNLVNLSIELAVRNRYSIYLLGGTKEVNSIALSNLRHKYPYLVLHGRDGFFDISEHVSIIAEIKSLNPNIVLIGISSPIKESLSLKFKQEEVGNIIIPCGGMIDVIAGKTKQTPELIKKLGLAMFFRLIQEPRRLFKSRVALIYEVFIIMIPRIIFHKLFLSTKFSFKKLYEKKE